MDLDNRDPCYATYFFLLDCHSTGYLRTEFQSHAFSAMQIGRKLVDIIYLDFSTHLDSHVQLRKYGLDEKNYYVTALFIGEMFIKRIGVTNS